MCVLSRINRNSIRLLAVGLIATLLGGCWQAPDSLMRIGTNVWPGYEPLYLARTLGYLDEKQFHLVEYSNASQVIASYRNGTIEAAALTLDEVLLLAQDGFDPRLVLVMDISHGGDVIIGRPGINSINDLKGRRVGVENTALGGFVLSRALEQAGMNISDVEIMPFTVDQHESVFSEGLVDAVVTFEPVRTRLLAAGNRLLFDSTQIPGEIVDVLIVSRAFLERHSERVRALGQGWFLALDYLKNQPRDAAQRMAKRLGITPEEVLKSYDGLVLPNRHDNRSLLVRTDKPAEMESTAERLAEIMYRDGLLSKIVDVSRLFSPIVPTLD